jgi:heptosyltransferase-2
MNVLILKRDATGDVVRTTSLVRRFDGLIAWVTAEKNVELLQGLDRDVHCVSWENRRLVKSAYYDLVINLEDDRETSSFLEELKFNQLFGAHLNGQNELVYTNDSRCWFDLSLISVHGREQADRLKLQNRRTYQELIFEGLGFRFESEKYVLPAPKPTSLSGDVALAPVAGPVWPMKTWAYYDELKTSLEAKGLRVNVLPRRSSLLEHLGDVSNHRCLVGGDSLPMHMALGLNVPCVTLFSCTSPWEIYDYGIQRKIISPLLEEFFYRRGMDQRATKAITVDEVFEAVMTQLNGSTEIDRIHHPI